MEKAYKDKNWLKNQYCEQQKSTRKIAKEIGCCKSTILNWMKRFNISARSDSDALHLSIGNHFKMTKEALEFLNGEILGDGCLVSQRRYSASFKYVSKHEEYIHYIADTLKSFGIEQSGKIHKRHHKRWNCYTYGYQSLYYSGLKFLRDKWYPNGKKIIPKDLKLTPLTLKQEYIGDGSLVKPKKGSPFILWSTCGFSISDVKWLIKQLNQLGFKTTRQSFDNSVRISAYSVKDFLDYIGECPVMCYRYKWGI